MAAQLAPWLAPSSLLCGLWFCVTVSQIHRSRESKGTTSSCYLMTKISPSKVSGVTAGLQQASQTPKWGFHCRWNNRSGTYVIPAEWFRPLLQLILPLINKPHLLTSLSVFTHKPLPAVFLLPGRRKTGSRLYKTHKPAAFTCPEDFAPARPSERGVRGPAAPDEAMSDLTFVK